MRGLSTLKWLDTVQLTIVGLSLNHSTPSQAVIEVPNYGRWFIDTILKHWT